MAGEDILKLFYENERKYIPLEDILSAIDLTKAQIDEEIKKLRDDGYSIDVEESGYRLTGSPSIILPYEVQKNLETKFLGKDIHFYREVDSTNEVARKLADEGAEDGTIVIAESQRSGKGRRGKKWVSPSGGVWMTMILRPDVEPNRAPQITLVAGVAVAETLFQECNLDIGIKWPNDILVGSKKISGILTEVKTNISGELEYVLVGVGIDLNVDVDSFPPELQNGATSLKVELDREIQGSELVKRFLQKFETRYNQFQAGNFREILNQWRKLSSTIGSQVEVHKKGRTVYGEAVGVNKDGKLIVELDDGTLQKIISGRCVHISKDG